MLNQTTINAAPAKEKNDYNNVKPSTSLLEMKNRYKQQKYKDDESDEDVQILAPKRPQNYDELLERQNEAEKKLQEQMDENTDKF